MKNLTFLFICFIVTSCTVIDKDFKSAVSFGEVWELNNYSQNIDKNLNLRLYQSPQFEKCVNATQSPCQYQYYLTVSTFEKQPQTSIYTLKSKGEIVNIEWIASAHPQENAVIEFDILPYTKLSLASNTTRKTSRVRVNVTPFEITEELIN